ncbi:MAG: UTP--glucose-1-phosphate uridylyltransferase [Deltaproteobacteria bacterium HGW-Deltaproteobacteria-18]|jgi:UTP--glucose-1-phosphate uridylyltransferase|nr:MAG: UTP--glucose-1-phosphate uridylyltransferase [Deltaproteobacteria bacterium HGW-Deltaproteobacteria-18]
MQVRKVVIPVAGWGTRSLPATKNVPKEILPVFRKPSIQYIVEEAIASGLSDVVFVNNQNKRIIEDHFDYNLALEQLLERKGQLDLLAEVRKVAMMANIIVVRQKEQLGLGHAVLCAREVIKDEPFAVMVGDDLMFNRDPGINQLLEVWKNERMPVVGVMEVPRDKVSKYGIIDAEEFAPGLYRIRGVKEKPSIESAPSRLALVGRYVLTPEVFDHLEGVKPDGTGEIQLTDALQSMARDNRLLAVKLRGQRFDVGDWVDYLTANIYFALQDEDLRYDLIARLRELIPPSR